MSIGTRKNKKILIGCGILLLGMNAVFLAGIALIAWEIRASSIRRQGSHPFELDPSSFNVVVFPKQDEPSLPVQRGVFLGLEELREDTIEVYVDGKPVSLETKRFTLVPEEGKEQDGIAALNREIERWGTDTDWRRVEYFIYRNGNEGESVIKLTVYTKKHGDRMEYLYRVAADGTIAPVWALHYNSI